MIRSHSEFKPVASRLPTLVGLLHHLNQLNSAFVPSKSFHAGLHNKPKKKPRRPHKPTRNQLRTPIPFLEQLKQCQNPDEFLTVFHDFSEMGYRHDYPSYATLIYKLSRAKRFEDVDALLNILQTRDIKCGEALFIGLIRHYGKAGMIEQATQVFREMGRSFNCVRTLQSFNTILNVLVNANQIYQAIGLFEGGPKLGFTLNVVSYNIMIKMWLTKGEWEKANKVLDKMLERGVEPTVVTYNCQIGFLCESGKVDEAKRFLEDMKRKGRQANAVTYALLMEGLCASGRFGEAKKIMFDMEYHGCQVQLVNYGVLMTDLANRGLFDEAKDLLSEMKKRKIKPDVVIYNILINCLCKEGAVSEGYKIVVDMQVNGCSPNAATYRMVVDGFCRVGDFSGGLMVLNAMLHSKHLPRSETFHSLSIGLFRSGKPDDLCFLLEELRKRNMVLDMESWEILVRECSGANHMVNGCLDDIICSG